MGPRYGSVYGLTFSAEPLDRLLLAWLERSAWDSIAADLVGRLDDRVIDAGLNLDFAGDIRFERPDLRLLLHAAALDLDIVRYFGFGNATTRADEAGFYHVFQQDYLLEPTLEWLPGSRTRLRPGGFFPAARADLTDESLLAEERPYGAGAFSESGISAGVTYDSRDLAAFPVRGGRIEAEARLVPPLFDVASGFRSVRIAGSAYLTAGSLPASPMLALRAGATRVFGRYHPFFEGAYIGGRGTLRGFNSRRFLGDGALNGSAELRLDLGSCTLVLPGEWASTP